MHIWFMFKYCKCLYILIYVYIFLEYDADVYAQWREKMKVYFQIIKLAVLLWFCEL